MSFIKIKLALVISLFSLAMMFTSCGAQKNYTYDPKDKVNNTEPVKVDPPKKEENSSTKQQESGQSSQPNTQKPETKPTNPSQKEESKDNTVKYKDTGEKVKYVQRRLIKFDYPISDDGDFGESTLWAVKDFQNRNNVVADGIVGDETLTKLNKTPTESTKYKPVNSQNNSSNGSINYSKFRGSKDNKESFANDNELYSATNSLITVSLKDKEVNIFNYSNKRWNLIKVFKCSVGAPSTPTVNGDFKISDKGDSFGQEKGYVCKYYTRFYGNYLFHSILYNLDGSVQDGRLGIEISHGCIRLEVENAKYIYNQIPQNTRVIIK